MMTRLVTSKATSQMGARCRISPCVRTEAIYFIADCRLPIADCVPEIALINRQSAIANRKSLDPAHHRVLPLYAFEQIEVGQHFASTQHHRGRRVVGEGTRQSLFDRESLVEILEQRAPAGQYDAALHDIG